MNEKSCWGTQCIMLWHQRSEFVAAVGSLPAIFVFRLIQFLVIASAAFAQAALAQNVISVPGASASPGAAPVTMTVDLTVDRNLSLLSADIEFDPTLCGAIAERGANATIDGVVVGSDESIAAGKDIIVRATNRLAQPLQEDLFDCADGRIPLRVFDLSGTPVVTDGTGAIATIEFDLRGDASQTDHSLTPTNVSAKLGPLNVAVTPQAGRLTITAPAQVCGNGVVESAEACDDGAANSDTEADACRTDCTLPVCGDGVIDTGKGERCDDGNTTPGDGCSATCGLEAPDHFLCHRVKESKANICRPEAGINAGGRCTTEEECGGASTGGSRTELCVRNKFPKNVNVLLDDDRERELFSVLKPLVLCNPADKNGEGIINADAHLKGYQIRAVKRRCAADAPANAFLACRREEDCGGVKKQTQWCEKPPRLGARKVRVTNQFGTVDLTASIADRLLVPSAKALDQPVDAPADIPLEHFKCYRTKLIDRKAFPRDLTAFVKDQFEQPRRYTIRPPDRLCSPVDKNDEGVADRQHHLLCYPVKIAPKVCRADAPANALEACRKETDCGGERRATTFCARQPRTDRVTGIHVNNQFGPELLETKGEEALCLPSTVEVP